jgi:two-component sensor histidine kinase/PAS domain-containing protein
MLAKLSEQICSCQDQAVEARRKAEATDDPARKRDFLEMENHWLFLARSYEFTEGLTDFVAANAPRPKQFGREQYDKNQNSSCELLPRLLFDQLPVAVYICEPNGLIVYFNDQAAQLWGRSPKLNDPDDRFCGSHRMFGVDGRPLLHAECPMAEVVRTGISVKDQEILIERADGSRGVALVNINAFKDASGKILGAVNCFQDITERKRSAEQVAILGREAEHRVKNILATVQATINLSQSDTIDGFKHAIEGRIQALANVHRLFYASPRKEIDLANVAKQELAPYLQDGVARARVEGPYTLLDPSIAQILAITLHELATNAAKYGALSEIEGRVEVSWSQRPDGRLTLRWTERDGPKITAPTRKGFGTRVMDTVIRNQLNGELRLDWRVDGLTCEIAFPIVDHASADDKLRTIETPTVDYVFTDHKPRTIDTSQLEVLQPAPTSPGSPLLESQ